MRRSSQLVPLIVFLIGLCLSIGAALLLKNNIYGEAESEFKHSVEATADHIISRFQKPTYGLVGIKGLYTTNKHVNRAAFRTYVESLDVPQQFSGMRGFGFVQHVLRTELDSFIAAEQADDAPSFALRQIMDKQHDDFYIIKLIEPAAHNVNIEGLDLGSEATRRSAILRAIETGMPTISGAITLLQDSRQTPGMLMFLPIFRNNANGSPPFTIEERRSSLIGLACSPIVINELLDGMLHAKAQRIDFELYDTPHDKRKKVLLYDADQHTTKLAANANTSEGRRFSEIKKITIHGKDLTLQINSTATLDAGMDQKSPWLLFVGGTLLSAMIAMLLRQQITNRSQAEALAKEMTAQLRRDELRSRDFSQCFSDWFWETDEKHCFSYVSRNFEISFGVPALELIGKNRNQLLKIVSINSQSFIKAHIATIEAHQPFKNFEHQIHEANGAIRWVSEAGIPFFNNNGEFAGYRGTSTIITERKKIELELLEHQLNLEVLVQQKTEAAIRSEQYLRTVIHTSLDAIIIMDANGIITEWSHQAEIIFGWTFAEIFGQKMQDFIMPKRFQDAHEKGMKHYSATSTGMILSKRIEISAVRRNGQEFPIELTVSPIITPQGTTFSAFIRDVTERKQEQAALITAKTMAESASRAKSDFLANMSHEIRTPMNGVIGMVDILQESPLLPDQQRMLQTIQQSSIALLQILNDILDFSKIEAGQLEVESIPTYLREVVEGAVQLMYSLSSARSVELRVFVSPELPQWILCDPSRLRQVLLNLLGNAVKFSGTKTGRIARVILWVDACTLDQGDAGVSLSITDNGIGMSEKVITKLFKPFTQADESTARQFGGTGLGLSITRRLVELMHGTISVTSKLDEGSTFTVKLPVHICEPGRKLIQLPGLTGVRVISVTRDQPMIKLLTAYLQAARASLTLVEDVATAHTLLSQEQRPLSNIVILIDLSIATPTADFNFPSEINVVRMVQRGGDSFKSDIRLFVLPVLYDDLINAIARASLRISLHEPTQAIERRLKPLRSNAPTIEEAAQTGRLILLAEDNETNREVMQEQLRLQGRTCELAEDGAIALHMWKNNPGRYALLMTDCHMPNLDGFKLTEAIRAAEHDNMHLPIIAVTANAMQGEAQRCLARGMDDYLSKPLRMSELASMLDKWLPEMEGKHTNSSSDQTPQKIEDIDQGNHRITAIHKPETLPIWDVNTLTVMIGDNPSMHRRMLEKFLPYAEKNVAEILAASRAGDTKTEANIAHALKSSARSVGALALGELCQGLETAGNANDTAQCQQLVIGIAAAFDAVSVEISAHLAHSQ